MRVAVLYPPLKTKPGTYPLLSQNRIFTVTASEGIKIYPLVMSTLVTMIKQDGHDILYLDGINLRMTREDFDKQVDAFRPELVVLETKAPVIMQHWAYIDEIKAKHGCTTILVGDHVTFFPQESLEKSQVDYVVTGGDYDVSILGLIKALELTADRRPPTAEDISAERTCPERSRRRAQDADNSVNGQRSTVDSGILPAGVYWKENGELKNSGKFERFQDLDSLPFIDRDLTRWDIYGEAYLYRPCAYILTGRGCGGRKRAGVCRFCIWQHSFWGCKAFLRSPKNVVDEIKILVEKYGVREIFDDNEAGGLWDIDWLRGFHEEMAKQKLIGKVILSTNARADCLDDETCRLLKKTGFRMLKIGLESGNNETLKKLVKDETIEEIEEGVRRAKDHGLATMITVMVGYPWESERDAQNTYDVAKRLALYKTHMGDSLEGNVLIPYPGTPLHKMCVENDWFTIDPSDYEEYGKSRPIVKSPIDPVKWCQKIWQIHREPKFILRSMLTLKRSDDIKLAIRGVRSLLGHESDYQEKARQKTAAL